MGEFVTTHALRSVFKTFESLGKTESDNNQVDTFDLPWKTLWNKYGFHETNMGFIRCRKSQGKLEIWKVMLGSGNCKGNKETYEKAMNFEQKPDGSQ